MKNKSRSITLVILIFALFACVIIGGCSLFGGENGEPKKTLKTPEVSRVGNIFSWSAVDRATNYIVSFGGKETSVSGTAFRLKDIEKGGTLSITAVKQTADGKITEESESVDIQLSVINESGSRYKRYEISNYSSDITIPAQIEKAVIVGEGQLHGADICIYIDTRTTPLIVELYDVHCYYFGMKNDDNTTPNECVIVRSLGEEGSSFHGASGSTGETGKYGGGLLGAGGKGGIGGAGGNAGRFNYVVFEGNMPITFQGGRGGNGGEGGVANQWNTSGGDGGAGGNGGTGLSATHAYIALESDKFICLGGAGGTGGEGGYGKFMGGMDSGDKGSNGSSGSAFTGSKEQITYQTVEAGKANNEDNNNDNNDNKDDGTASSGNVTGTYKFYSMSEGENIFYAGDEFDGEIIARNRVVFVFKDDNTCDAEFTHGSEKQSAVLKWEKYQTTIFFTDENDNITRATINGEFITISIGNSTLTLKEDK
ncbi:MAG: hypothetical protein K2L12_06115 [Clostridia bacterium]|nr:hypothetical protein [Clostridia bacterium]